MIRLAALALLLSACGSNPFVDYIGICRAGGGECTSGGTCRGIVGPENCNPNITPGGRVCCKPEPDGG